MWDSGPLTVKQGVNFRSQAAISAQKSLTLVTFACISLTCLVKVIKNCGTLLISATQEKKMRSTGLSVLVISVVNKGRFHDTESKKKI
jgi:hypothetical protein